MSKSRILYVILGVAIVAFVVMLLGQKGSMANGRVVFAITDKAASLENIESVMLTTSKLEAESAQGGWVTVSEENKQFDLLALKQSGDLQVLAEAELAAGTYNQFRLTVDRVEVTASGEAAVEAKLPSNELKFVNRIVVEPEKTSTVVMDFLLDVSLHMTGNGEYVFTPVVKLETRNNASAEVRSDGTVLISGGSMDVNVTVGMDLNGELKENFKINENAAVEIVGGEIRITTEAKTEVVVALSAQNNSGITGTATLTEMNGQTKVVINASGSGILSIAQPAHIHTGSCAALGAVKYALTSVINGRSETVLDVPLAQLKTEGALAVNIHKSVAESGVYVTCADLNLNAAAASAGPVTVNISAQNSSGITGTAVLTEENGKVKVVVSVSGAGVLAIAQPAHIHTGTCATLGGVKYSLSSVINGKSETVINATLAQLRSEGDLAVNIHKSIAESGVYVACGNLEL